MRLTAHEQAAIKLSAKDVFGSDARVRVFGSRLNDARRGGDIDLYIEVEETLRSNEAAARFRLLLDRRVGERDNDIILGVPGYPASPVARKAVEEGVIL